MTEKIVFRKANERDYEKIHKLNHQIFASELQQYKTSITNSLVDKFHHKNTYFIAEHQSNVIGMVSVHYEFPFSVMEKWPDIDQKIEDFNTVAEVRLFAIKPDFRKKGHIAWGLILKVYDFLAPKAIDKIVISGISQQKKLYEYIGFECIGEAVYSGKSKFFPMIMTREQFLKRNHEKIKHINTRLKR